METIGIPSQRVLSTYMVECRVSILGIIIMVWEGIPHNSTLDPLGLTEIPETFSLNPEAP